jgi:hypothetical protein
LRICHISAEILITLVAPRYHVQTHIYNYSSVILQETCSRTHTTSMTIAVLSLRGGLRASNPLRQPLSRQPNPLIRRRNATNSTPSKGRPDPATAQGTGIPVPAILPSLPLWQRLGPLSRFFEAYGRSQRKRPLTTQFISSLIIYFCGDQCAQSINGEPYDPKRTVKALIIGAGSSIPSYKWYAPPPLPPSSPPLLLSSSSKPRTQLNNTKF